MERTAWAQRDDPLFSKSLVCIDNCHGTPCPQPCEGCKDEGCDPAAIVTWKEADQPHPKFGKGLVA